MQSNQFILGPASEYKDRFTPSQKAFWDKLFSNSPENQPINRNAFAPMNFVEFLPRIWMADLISDEDGKLHDIEVRLFGTKLAEVYGERTNQRLFTNDSESGLKTEMELTFERTMVMVHEMYDKNTAMYSDVSFLEKKKQHLNATALLFPMCKNSDTVNMLFGYVEHSYVK